MDQPRRRPSPAVYRRRRIVVLLLAMLVVAGIVWLVIAQPWRALGDVFAQTEDEPAPVTSETPLPVGSPAASGSPSPTPTADPSASAEADADEPATPQPCDPKVIELLPRVSGEIFQKKPVELRIRLTNTGPTDCTFDVGTSKQRFVITSGKDTWWRSTDCQSEPSDMVVTLAAGQTVESQEPLVWDRTRSSVDTCDSQSRPRAPGGGAAYNLSVEIGDVKSAREAQFYLR